MTGKEVAAWAQIREFFLTSVFCLQPMLDPVILTTIQDVRSVEEKDLKDKVITPSPGRAYAG